MVSFGCVMSRSVEDAALGLISFVELVVESLILLVVYPLAVVVVSSALLVWSLMLLCLQVLSFF